MRFLRHTYIIILFLTNAIAINAQIQFDSIAQHVAHVGHILVPERAYMHFDNSSYLLGDTIRYKAIVTKYDNDKPTTLSSVLYIELLSPEGKVLNKQKKKIDEKGACSGYIALDSLYHSGYFEVRAYTRYMLNWGDEAIFSRVFPVFDKKSENRTEGLRMVKRARSNIHDNLECRLNIYPEGGTLVNGLESKVAYELTDGTGKWLQQEITLYENGEPLLTSIPIHNGKGIFSFTPVKGAEYIIRTTLEEKEHVFKLPEIKEQGALVSVENKEFIIIRVRSNDTSEAPLNLAIMHRSTMALHKNIEAGGEVFTVFPEELPEGVNRVVLYSGDTLLAERLFFVHHKVPLFGGRQTIKLKVTANKQAIDTFKAMPHEKIEIVIAREDGKPINEEHEFSVAVTDNNRKVETSWEHNMYTYMLLASELKGYIPYVGQYFDESNKECKEQIDLMMLTHGWTAYDWNKLAKDNFENFVLPEKGITICGSMYRKTIEPQSGIIKYHNVRKFPSYIELEDGNKKSRFITDEKGLFELQLRENFEGKRNLTITTATKPTYIKNAVYGYSIFEKPSPAPRAYHYLETISLPDSLIEELHQPIEPIMQDDEQSRYDAAQEDAKEPIFKTGITGYTPDNKFYSRNYSEEEVDSADYRSTLYWNPSIKPIENGTIKITLYGNATGGSIGVDVSGHVGSSFYSNSPYIRTRFISGMKYDEYISSGYTNDSLIYRQPDDESILAFCRKQNQEGMSYYNRGDFDVAIDCFTGLMEYNYPPALTNIGIAFMNGAGIYRSMRRASLFFKMASEMNEPTAQMHLGSMYAKGIYLPQNDSIALHWYLKSAKNGMTESMVAGGRILMYSEQIEKDATAAGELFRKAAIKENAEGLYMYGIYLRLHKRKFKDKELGRADDCIAKAAKLGYKDAQLELMYSSITQERYNLTFHWAQELHNKGYVEGTATLADCYRYGNGTAYDPDRAKALYKEAAERGDEASQKKLLEFQMKK